MITYDVKEIKKNKKVKYRLLLMNSILLKHSSVESTGSVR